MCVRVSASVVCLPVLQLGVIAVVVVVSSCGSSSSSFSLCGPVT
jgi:hypothetical protein